MGSKTISLNNKAYDVLNREKTGSESFSKVVMRLVSKRGDIDAYAGAWKDMSSSDIKRMEEGINKMRKDATDALTK